MVNSQSKIDWKRGKDLKLPLAKNWKEGRENKPRWPSIFFSFFSQLTFCCFCCNWPFQIPVAQPQTKSSLHTFCSSATERIPLSLTIHLKYYLLSQWFSTTKILDVLLWIKWWGMVLVTRVRNEFQEYLGFPTDLNFPDLYFYKLIRHLTPVQTFYCLQLHLRLTTQIMLSSFLSFEFAFSRPSGSILPLCSK